MERKEPSSDLDLVHEVRNGNRRAFTELMRRYQQRLYWSARRIVGRHEEADDVVQEAFIKAYVSLGDFREESTFYTWLYRIVINLSLNAVRKRQVVSYLRESDIINRFFPSGDDPSRDVEEQELASTLEKAVRALPERQRAVFVMRYFDEMPYAEISRVLKTSVGGLKANYFHALKKVQEALKHEVQTTTVGRGGGSGERTGG